MPNVICSFNLKSDTNVTSQMEFFYIKLPNFYADHVIKNPSLTSLNNLNNHLISHPQVSNQTTNMDALVIDP